MQFLNDFLPIVIFFFAYKVWGIYAATLSAILVCVSQVLYIYFKGKKPQMSQWISLGLIVVLGGATLLFKNEWFIKWKPTALYWLFSILLFGSQWVGQRPIIQRLLEKNIQLTRPVWLKLNFCWAIFFAVMGALNIYIAYHFNTNVWVNFKLFGSLGLTFIFILFQAWFISKSCSHLPADGDNSNAK